SGETFEGVISGITEWGFFVELENTVEGLVRLADLCDDYYHYEEGSYELVGERTGRCYKLGQKVLVRVKSCDKVLRTIDFEMA
ncbi:MAG: S1 RNA-binding domain-containing protein, partial [Fibrobacter sp.]|nr:S1 RNA-binding domain-containing protein [Fibrobacter sp.]